MPICRHRTHVNWFLSFNVGILYILEFFTPDVRIMEQEGSSFLYIIFFLFFLHSCLKPNRPSIYIYKTRIIIQYIYIYIGSYTCAHKYNTINPQSHRLLFQTVAGNRYAVSVIIIIAHDIIHMCLYHIFNTSTAMIII